MWEDTRVAFAKLNGSLIYGIHIKGAISYILRKCKWINEGLYCTG